MSFVRQRIKAVVTTLLGKKLDQRSKRMIVLASLGAEAIANTDRKIDIGIAHKLNQVLKLSNSDEALMFPMQLRKVIWNDGDATLQLKSDTLSTTDTKQLATYLLSLIPSWLQYCDKESMFSDIENLLNHRKQLAI